MMLRCTKKLLAVLGPVGFTDAAPTPNDEDWYANLLWCERRKCLLLTHAGTLFTIFEADVRAAELRATAACQRSSNPAAQRDGVQVIQHPGVHVIPHF
jgi:hypothetical protein